MFVAAFVVSSLELSSAYPSVGGQEYSAFIQGGTVFSNHLSHGYSIRWNGIFFRGNSFIFNKMGPQI